MNKALLAAVAAGIVSFAAVGALAQDEKLYLSTNAGKSTVLGGAAPHVVLMGTGAKPAECAPGEYYMTDASQQMVMRCDDDARFTLSDITAGAMTAAGEPVPEGSKLMTPAK